MNCPCGWSGKISELTVFTTTYDAIDLTYCPKCNKYLELKTTKIMELKIEETTAKKLYPETPGWFQDILIETFGKKCFKKRDFNSIKTFEDACNELDINCNSVIYSNDSSDEIAYKKLKIIVKAINQGWVPNWDDSDQRKWFPYFNLSSGFGFSVSGYYFGRTVTTVGSRLCFESEGKATYAGKQFQDIYEELLTIKN
jgi:hypothetical protein